MFTTIYYSPFGPIFLRADDNALLELHFIDEAILNADPKSTNSNNATTNSLILGATFRWLDQYFAGQQPDFLPPFRLDLTPFNCRVLEIASQVPFGETITYGEIADIIAAERGLFKMAAQAVGTAMRKNPICLIIPCHRVVGANHRLGGYNGNSARKRQLLTHEGVNTTQLI